MSDHVGEHDQGESAAVRDVDFGARLRTRREEVGLSQSDLGQLAGVHRGTIRNVEMGKAMEVRTAANIKRALGCAPSVNYLGREESRAGVESLRPVLSARATQILVSAVLRSAEEDLPTRIRDYFDLVNSLSLIPPDLPPTLPRFWDGLTFLLTPADRELVDREIRDAVTATGTVIGGINYPFGEPTGPSVPSRGRTEARIPRPLGDQLPNSVVGAIVQSGLPESLQRTLLREMASRQAVLREHALRQMEKEVSAILDATTKLIGTVTKSQPDRADDPEWQATVGQALAGTLNKMFSEITAIEWSTDN